MPSLKALLSHFFVGRVFPLSYDLGLIIDAQKITLIKQGKVVYEQPACMVWNEERQEVLAVGTLASQLVGKTPSSSKVVFPFAFDRLHSADQLKTYLEVVLHEVSLREAWWPNRRWWVCIPGAWSEFHRKQLKEVLLSLGGWGITFFFREYCMVRGGGKNIPETGLWVVGVGGGSSEVVLIDPVGVCTVKASVEKGFLDVVEGVRREVRSRHQLEIGWASAVKVTTELLLHENQSKKKMVVRGKDTVEGKPGSRTVAYEDVAGAISQLATAISLLLHDTRQVVWMSGSGALVTGLAQEVARLSGCTVELSATSQKDTEVGLLVCMAERKRYVKKQGKKRKI